MKKVLLMSLCGSMLLMGACADSHKPVVAEKITRDAEEFPLSDVRLLEGCMFKNAMDKDGEWLLAISPDRLLHRFRLNAGLEPKGEIYGGWESRGVSGHTLGHYLTACSKMYAASGDERFKERVDYIVDQLAECQAARGTGYVGAIPDEDRIWNEVSAGDIRSQGFDLNGGWVPWYTMHKIWEGLIDAYYWAGNDDAKDVVVKLSDWAVDKFGGLSDEQFQKMMACEFGGMNEVLAEVYAMTGDTRYLDLGRKFYHKAILDPLAAQRDELAGKHSNTQVPKIIGEARIYELTGDEKEKQIATYYWGRIVNHHSYANGGNSNYEHLGEPDKLNDRLSAFTSETCNTYNMLKLTKHLFGWEAKSEYMDYYERALYNHIFASQNPEDGMVCYSVPLESGTEKIFSTPFDSFWCCVGSGIENHVKYAESVFFKSVDDGGLYVNLFIPTELDWKERGLTVKMETDFPETDVVHISFEGEAQEFPLYIRCPEWLADSMTVSASDGRADMKFPSGTYATVNGKWGEGVSLDVKLPMDLYTVAMPDNPDRMAIFYGPVLLAAPLGEGDLNVEDIPCFVYDDNKSVLGTARKDDASLSFTIATTVSDAQKLIPFYAVYGQKHAVYFDAYTESDWRVKSREIMRQAQARKDLEARTIDNLRIGEMQPERDHNLTSENSSVGAVDGHNYRHAFDGWFAFDAKVDGKRNMQMICSYWVADKDKRNFDILIDGKLFKTVELSGEHGNKLFDAVYDIPASFTRGKDSIQVCFKSHPGNYAGGLFGFRTVLKK